MLELHAAGVPLGEIITTSVIATAVLAFAMQDTLGNSRYSQRHDDEEPVQSTG